MPKKRYKLEHTLLSKKISTNLKPAMLTLFKKYINENEGLTYSRAARLILIDFLNNYEKEGAEIVFVQTLKKTFININNISTVDKVEIKNRKGKLKEVYKAITHMGETHYFSLKNYNLSRFLEK